MTRTTPLVALVLIGALAACDGSSQESVSTAPDATTVTTTATTSSAATPVTTAATTSAEAQRTEAPTVPSSSVPAAFAEREPYPSCGEDFSLSLDPMGPASTQRRCFLDANESSKPAELTAHETGTASGASSRLVYRTNADRSVDVYVAAAPGQPWKTFHCSIAAPDERRVFQLVDCGDPVDVP